MSDQVDIRPAGRPEREHWFELKAENVNGFLHRAEIDGFEIWCDEPQTMGGGNAHPYPLHYFTASVAF